MKKGDIIAIEVCPHCGDYIDITEHIDGVCHCHMCNAPFLHNTAIITHHWISTKDYLPAPGKRVEIIRDVRKWGSNHSPHIDIATTHYKPVPFEVGGGLGITPTVTINTVYFAVPSILHPEEVTHWRDLPDISGVINSVEGGE